MEIGSLQGKRILITGGTGSLGRVLLKRLLNYKRMGKPASITIFSRDEAKQHQLRVAYQIGSSELLERFNEVVQFRIGDVRDLHSLMPAVKQSEVIINSAAMKQVPTCEYFPQEAIKTNVVGAMNIVSAISDHQTPVELVVGVSTDKAAKPVNVMGMTKALQERVLLQANMLCPTTRFVCVRYGNVMASRGSVIPLFHEQINNNLNVTVTDNRMTRFLLNLDSAVDIIFEAIITGNRGDVYVPHVRSARIMDVAEVMIGRRKIGIDEIGIRPGEKLHEILISEDEGRRAIKRGRHYVIPSSLPEIHEDVDAENAFLNSEYSSEHDLLSKEELRDILAANNLLPDD